MPYVVTTKRPGMGTSENLSIRPGGYFAQRLAAVSRRAVATLEEARVMVFAAWPTESVAWRDYEGRIPESGGTVGPLPDGTVIEVEPIPGFVLAKFAELSAQDALACSLLQDWTPAIAAFNAREASHA